MPENTKEISPNFIDVRALFATKNPRLLKIIPGVFFTIIKRIIHQDSVNEIIYNHREKSGLDFVAATLDTFGVNIEAAKASGYQRQEDQGPLIPSSGRFIIASNHPLGGLDGLALMHVVGKVRPEVVFPVNDLLMFIPGLEPLFIPINKHGKNTENVTIIHQTFASDKTILYFPAGLVSRKGKKGTIRDLEWKKTFITQARRYNRDIIPVYITGRNTNFFYNLANLRKKLGIKANIEMLLLPDEMFRQKNKTVRLTFGDPIPCSSLDRSHSDQEWAAIIREKVYSLAE
ncbi:MAG: 1-acyl-sn-glycerol-3-phosphate acyltransferase [Bacteroidetes bacterium]|nr:1-acyl-sn-glycerol-3-phosphate acyltransferase [Bacteroidota bacterium]